jgi:2-polyprenyl-6-methoxyphenol hydroxylase-like FAD-dependent oxidoreductase
VLAADLVVDATGRGSRTPVFLQSLGYGRPREDELMVRLAYATQPLHIPVGAMAESLVAVFPEPGRPTTFAMVGYENDTWMLTVGSMHGHEPPSHFDEMVCFAEEFAPADALAAVRRASPTGDVVQHRVPSNRWRRYDKMRRMPDGLLVTGDAICSFNPIYGQGMTVAALDAIALRHCLRDGSDDLPRRFFRASAKKIGVAWQLAVGSDLALPEVAGARPLSMRITNFYVERILRAAETDPVVAERFLRVTGMVDSPTRLFDPSLVWHVMRANRRSAAAGRRTSPTTVGEPAGVVTDSTFGPLVEPWTG